MIIRLVPLLPWLLWLAAAGCARPSAQATPTGAAGAAGNAATAVSAAAIDPLSELVAPVPQGEQPREHTLAHPGYREALASVKDILAARFAGVADEQVRLQAAPLPQGGRALFLYAPETKARPLMLALDEQRSPGWLKERPVDDLDRGLGFFSFCPGPQGDLTLYFHDPPTRVLGARRWDRGGGLLSDFRLAEVDALQASAALYWPGRGWLLVYAAGGVLRGQLMGEQGQFFWGRGGRVLVNVGVQPGPLRMLLDTEVSAVILWPGAASDASRRHTAIRVDFEGNALWRAPVDLGEAAATAPAQLERVENGLVRARLPRGQGISYEVELTAEGQVRIH